MGETKGCHRSISQTEILKDKGFLFGRVAIRTMVALNGIQSFFQVMAKPHKTNDQQSSTLTKYGSVAAAAAPHFSLKGIFLAAGKLFWTFSRRYAKIKVHNCLKATILSFVAITSGTIYCPAKFIIMTGLKVTKLFAGNSLICAFCPL